MKKITKEEWLVMREKQQRFLSVDSLFDPSYNLLRTPLHEWTSWMRRFYLLTYPISMPLRWSLFVGVVMLWLLTISVSVLLNWLYCMWIGIPTYWQKNPDIEGYNKDDYEPY